MICFYALIDRIKYFEIHILSCKLPNIPIKLYGSSKTQSKKI